LVVTPVSITFDSGASSYSFTGAGKISGVGSLTMNGFQPVTLGTANDYSGGTTVNAGTIYAATDQALGSGPVNLNFGTLASDSPTPRTLANSITQNANTGIILGDTANSGTLILAGGLNLGGGTARTLNFNSDVVITGSLTNGGIATKTGPGALIIKGNSFQSVLASQLQGDVIIDGAQFTSGDGWRLQNTSPGTTIRLVVTNGGVFNVAVNFASGNLRVGLAGGDNSANNIVDLSGTLNMTPLAGVGANSAVNLGSSGANAILYLRSGGLLMTRAIYGSSPANAEVHFMGGTLKAIANEAGFIQGLTNAFVDEGGLTIDTTNFSVTAAQALVASGTGGLTKVGTGTLTLTGTNTYTGPTVVNAGKLVL
jgi:autotransporter-associated beta strand protein